MEFVLEIEKKILKTLKWCSLPNKSDLYNLLKFLFSIQTEQLRSLEQQMTRREWWGHLHFCCTHLSGIQVPIWWSTHTSSHIYWAVPHPHLVESVLYNCRILFNPFLQLTKTRELFAKWSHCFGSSLKQCLPRKRQGGEEGAGFSSQHSWIGPSMAGDHGMRMHHGQQDEQKAPESVINPGFII